MEQTGDRKKILILEDETQLLDVLRDEFTQAGFEVFKAKDGEQGYALALENRPDLILADILMPKMDGLAMFKKLRVHEELKKTPGIILTNLSDSGTISKALESGAYDFLVKSDWEPKNLVLRVKEKLAMGGS